MSYHLTNEGLYLRCQAKTPESCYYGGHYKSVAHAERVNHPDRKDRKKNGEPFKKGLFGLHGKTYKVDGSLLRPPPKSQPMTGAERVRAFRKRKADAAKQAAKLEAYEQKRQLIARKKMLAEAKKKEAAGYKALHVQQRKDFEAKLKKLADKKGVKAPKIEWADSPAPYSLKSEADGKPCEPFLLLDWWVPPGESVESVWDGFADWFFENGGGSSKGWLEEAMAEGARA